MPGTTSTKVVSKGFVAVTISVPTVFVTVVEPEETNVRVEHVERLTAIVSMLVCDSVVVTRAVPDVFVTVVTPVEVTTEVCQI